MIAITGLHRLRRPYGQLYDRCPEAALDGEGVDAPIQAPTASTLHAEGGRSIHIVPALMAAGGFKASSAGVAAAAGHVVQLVVGQLAGLGMQPVKVRLGLLLGQLNTVFLCQRQQLLGGLRRPCLRQLLIAQFQSPFPPDA